MYRENRKKQTKADIVQHAISLFKQKGYEKVTVEEITNACGIAKGTFFNYFPKKEYILLHLTDSYMELLDHILHKYDGASLKDQILFIYRDLITLYAKYADLLRLTLEETIRFSIRSHTEQTNIMRFQKSLGAIIESAKNNGSFQSQWKTDQISSILTGLLINVLIHYSSPLDKAQMLEELKNQLNIVWEGIIHESMEENRKK
ncbi:TetR/AcrR family transcriptional regulator [Shimazuella kribbensis]|uniref:TetR/AcrR family transcriptional regulator n=1 Tax=Shimazuella kribbensis TaxID=139808 RepID=UPI000428EE27|nr:TetR/AcrR family transcriptional regulator [Shimazuella kribbensis]